MMRPLFYPLVFLLTSAYDKASGELGATCQPVNPSTRHPVNPSTNK